MVLIHEKIHCCLLLSPVRWIPHFVLCHTGILAILVHLISVPAFPFKLPLPLLIIRCRENPRFRDSYPMCRGLLASAILPAIFFFIVMLSAFGMLIIKR